MRRTPRDPHDDPPGRRNRSPVGPIPTIGQLPERQAWPVGSRGLGTRYSDRRYQFVHKISADLGMKIGRAA
jgi:hypothetical protein